MKQTLNFFLCLALLLTLSSCGDEESKTIAESLQGTWTAVSFDAFITTSSDVVPADFGSTSDVVASNLNYDLTLDETDFTISGSYAMTVNTQANGLNFPAQTTTYTNVSGSGTYTHDEHTLTIRGSLFNMELNNINVVSMTEEQTSNYEINSAGDLVMDKDFTMIDNSNGFDIEIRIMSNSVWRRK